MRIRQSIAITAIAATSLAIPTPAGAASDRCPPRNDVDTYLHAIAAENRVTVDVYLKAVQAVTTTAPYRPVLNLLGGVEADPRCGYETNGHHGRYGFIEGGAWVSSLEAADFVEYVDVAPEDAPPIVQDAAAVALIRAGGLGRTWGWSWATWVRKYLPK